MTISIIAFLSALLIELLAGWVLLTVVGDKVKELSKRVDDIAVLCLYNQKKGNIQLPVQPTLDTANDSPDDWRLWDDSVAQWESEGGHV